MSNNTSTPCISSSAGTFVNTPPAWGHFLSPILRRDELCAQSRPLQTPQLDWTVGRGPAFVTILPVFCRIPVAVQGRIVHSFLAIPLSSQLQHFVVFIILNRYRRVDLRINVSVRKRVQVGQHFLVVHVPQMTGCGYTDEL